MTDILEAPLKTEDFKKAVVEHEAFINAQIAEQIANLSGEVKALIESQFEEQRKAIVAAYLPTLEEPDKIEFKVAELNGVMRTKDTPQEAVILRGKGRTMQVVLTWKGLPQ